MLKHNEYRSSRSVASQGNQALDKLFEGAFVKIVHPTFH